MPEASWGRATRWLTVLTVDPEEFGASRDDIIQALGQENIEARPVWKPMHLQPAFSAFDLVGGPIAEDLFERGLCLPSGSSLAESDIDRIVAVMIDASEN